MFFQEKRKRGRNRVALSCNKGMVEKRQPRCAGCGEIGGCPNDPSAGDGAEGDREGLASESVARVYSRERRKPSYQGKEKGEEARGV